MNVGELILKLLEHDQNLEVQMAMPDSLHPKPVAYVLLENDQRETETVTVVTLRT